MYAWIFDGSDDPRDHAVVSPGRHGNKEQVFYVGKAKNLRSRIRGLLSNHGLMIAITKAKSGKRQLVWAELKLRPGQKAAQALSVAERFMIRHFAGARQPIHNVHGTKVKVPRLTNKKGRSTPEFVPHEVTMTTSE